MVFFKKQFFFLRYFILTVSTCSVCVQCGPAQIQTIKASNSSVNIHTSVLDRIKKSGVIRVGTTGDFSPFSYRLDSIGNAYHGIDIELAKDLGRALNAEVQFVETTWPSLMIDLHANKFDIGMSGITITLARQQNALFSAPLLSSGKAAITRDENTHLYNTIEAINSPGVRVIVNPGGTNESFSRQHFPKATIVENENNLSVFQKIVDGEVDLMVTDATETLVQQLIHPELEAVNPNEPFNFFEMGYLLPIDHTFKAYVDQWINLRLKDGTYQSIFDNELAKIADRALSGN